MRLTNPPQHSAGAYGREAEEAGREGLPTGVGTSAGKDVADPHPSDEEHPYRARRPGGRPDPRDPGPNDAELPYRDGSKR